MKEVKILLVLVILSIAQSKDRQLSLLEYNSLDNKECSANLWVKFGVISSEFGAVRKRRLARPLAMDFNIFGSLD